MNADVSWSASFTIRAREKTARGDALIDRLPIAPDRTGRRGEAMNVHSNRAWTESWADYCVDGSDPRELPGGVAALLARLAPHEAAFRVLSPGIVTSLELVPYGCVAPWRLDLPADTVQALYRWDALIDVDAYMWPFSGTEHGDTCTYCRLERPTSPDDPRIVSLQSPGPARGTADARIVLSDVHDARAELLCTAFPAGDYLASARAYVASVSQEPFGARRGGAVALGTLLRHVRKHANFVRLAAAARPSPNVEVRCWANSFNAGLHIMRRDIRRLTKLSASLTIVLDAAPIPAFHGGRCFHCDYVLPGFRAEIDSPES